MNYDFAFIITYSHAGGSILQEILNSAPDVCIRGANAGAVAALSRVIANLQATEQFSGIAKSPASPWYGADVVSAESYTRETVQSFIKHVLRPPLHNKMLGFTETRHLMPNRQFTEYCDFLRANFPRAVLIFNTRNSLDILGIDRNVDIAELDRANKNFSTYATANPDDCICIRYEDYTDGNSMGQLLTKLGINPKGKSVHAALAKNNIPTTEASTLTVGHVENGVIVGQDGWLFLWDGSNQVHRYYTDANYFGTREIDLWLRLLQTRKNKLSRLGVKYRHLTVPDKISLFPEKVPHALPYFSRHPACQLANRTAIEDDYIDLLEPLISLPQNKIPFYKTDTHWNFFGCYAAYKRTCESLGIIPRDFPLPPTGGHERVLDLGGKFSPPIKEHVQFISVMQKSRRIAENHLVRYNESIGLKEGKPKFVGCYIRTKNDSTDAVPETLIIFGDSFSEFRPHMLTAMFAETYREVHFVWSTDIDYDLIKKIKPSVVITEIAERFMKRLPTDTFKTALD